MLKIIYAEDGETVSDFQLESWAANLVSKNAESVIDEDIEVRVSAEMMITMLRVLLKRGTIKNDEISFYTSEGEWVGPNNRGNIDWVKGFCDKSDYFLDELIDWT